MAEAKIRCPHCAYIYRDDDMHESEHDLWSIAPKEEGVAETCKRCGETFFILGSYIPQYETHKSEEEYYDES